MDRVCHSLTFVRMRGAWWAEVEGFELKPRKMERICEVWNSKLNLENVYQLYLN